MKVDFAKLMEYYKMGKEMERHILLNILKYGVGLDDEGIERLLTIEKSMDGNVIPDE